MIEHRTEDIESRAFAMSEIWRKNVDDMGLMFISELNLAAQEQSQIVFKLTFIMKLYCMYIKNKSIKKMDRLHRRAEKEYQNIKQLDIGKSFKSSKKLVASIEYVSMLINNTED
jgi:hypothetical protein